MAQETKPTDVATSENAAEAVVASPFCRELRSNRYYFLQSLPTEAHQLLDPSKHCWCRKTMQAFGPDGQRARPESCTPGRGCYHSAFDE